ncbi:hypothetical protein EDB19DRAFT_265645, partial [Suillus lakei]
KQKKEDTIRGLDGNIALAKLNEQILVYSKGAWPFNRPLSDNMNILKYWTGFLDHDNADILAVHNLQVINYHLVELCSPQSSEKHYTCQPSPNLTVAFNEP